ncbi:MAG: DMT family transporter [Coriobacteriales bacterium]|nr:DMT family transporter [Actinomycetes bacterium]
MILLALTASFAYGWSDFAGGQASKGDSAFSVTATAQITSGIVLVAAAFLWNGAPSTGALARGAIAGACGGLGIAALYGALAIGRMSVVSPVTAALSGSLPALVDLARGTRVTGLSIAGMVLAVVAVVIVSASAETEPTEERSRDVPALGLALVAGVLFAVGIVALSRTEAVSGLWPLVAARIVSVAVASGLAMWRAGHVVATRVARAGAITAGALDAVANVTMLLALRIGPVAVASVLSSLYPVVIVVLALVVLKERLRGVQQLGVALAIAAVVLTALR